ncbi:hypothetical protein AAFC00_001463 [Neodothiora populina]
MRSRSVERNVDRNTDIELQTLNNAQTASPPWRTEFVAISRKCVRQICGKNPFKVSYLSLFWPLKSASERLTLLAGILFAIAAGVPLPIIGLIFEKIINSFPPSEHELHTALVQLMGVAVGYFAVTAGYTICWGLTGERLSRKLREMLVQRLLGLDQAFFDVENPDVTNLLTEKIELIQIGTSEKVGIFIQSISYFVAAFVVGFILNAKLTGILLAAVIPLMITIVVVGSSRVAKYARAASEYTESAARIAEGSIDAVRVVQAFGMADRLSDEHSRLLRLAARFAIRKSMAGAIMLGCVYFVAYAANALAFWEGSNIAIATEAHNAGTIYAVVFLILDAAFVVGQFGPFLGVFATAAASGEKIFAILDRPQPDIDVYSTQGSTPDENTMHSDICFNSVSFAYPARTAVRALESLDLTLEGGAMNAIVGPSGSGKSTFVSLLLRLYDVSSGKITIGGHDICDFNITGLRNYISLVDQESVIFSGSVLDNIRHGLNDSSLTTNQVEELCNEAAEAANLDFVEYLPEGMHTQIGLGGNAQLSGGQRQRICLARALVKKPSILLLDEPTSALDATSERLVMDSVRRAAANGTTVVMVAHRLSTVMDSKKIVLMGAGQVIEQGSHDYLIGLDGAYKNLVHAQRLGETSSDESEDEVSERLSRDTVTPGEKQKLSSVEEKYTPLRQAENQSETRSGFFYLLGRCLKLARSDSLLVYAGLIGSLVSGGIILGEAIIFGNLVTLLNGDIQSQNFRDRADFFCLLFFVLSLIALVSYSLSGCAFGVVSAHFVAKVQNISLRSILRQDMQWFTGQSASSLMTSLSSDAGQLSCLSGVALGTIFTVATSVIGGMILAHVVAWKIAIVLLAAVPVMVLAGYVRLRVLALSEARHRSAYNDAASIAAEACRAIRTIAAIGRERGTYEAYAAAIKKPYDHGIRFTFIANTLLALSFSITYFVYALAYWWGARQVREGTYGQLQFFIVLPALLFSAQSAGQVFSLSPEMSRAGVAARNVFALHDQKPTIIDTNNKTSDSISTLDSSTKSGKTLAVCNGQIDLVDVSLCYPSKPNAPAVKNLNIAIKPGEFIAFVGPSGAGKSTIISLLQRFYDPTFGTVKVDGEDIRKVPVEWHRSRLGLVPQEPDLFPGSISYNIGLGAAPGQQVTDDKIIEVCKRCGIHDFIMSLPEAYNTECGTNGSKLSGGQRQRVAVARALIRSPQVLLLDEYTSALDAHSEQHIKKAVDGAAEGRTTIVVAHRLSTIQNATRIYVFDDGEVQEVGTHDQLVAAGGLYASLVKTQTLS